MAYNKHERLFADVLSATLARRLGKDAGKYQRKYGVNELLRDILGENDKPDVIAVKALVQMCSDDGGYNGFEPGLSAVLNYLAKDTIAPPKGERFKSAVQALFDNQFTEEGLTNWVHNWYTI